MGSMMTDQPLSSQGVKIHDGGERGARAYTEFEFEGVVYAIEVVRDATGRTTQTFFTSPPPQGLDRVRYQWTGKLR
jgi:hypothetical protein